MSFSVIEGKMTPERAEEVVKEPEVVFLENLTNTARAAEALEKKRGGLRAPFEVVW